MNTLEIIQAATEQGGQDGLVQRQSNAKPAVHEADDEGSKPCRDALMVQKLCGNASPELTDDPSHRCCPRQTLIWSASQHHLHATFPSRQRLGSVDKTRGSSKFSCTSFGFTTSAQTEGEPTSLPTLTEQPLPLSRSESLLDALPPQPTMSHLQVVSTTIARSWFGHVGNANRVCRTAS